MLLSVSGIEPSLDGHEAEHHEDTDHEVKVGQIRGHRSVYDYYELRFRVKMIGLTRGRY